MSPLVAPILAQLITLGTHDRVEARYVHAADKVWEGSMTPGAILTFAWPRYDLSVGYDANMLLTPLDSEPREFLLLNNVHVSAGYGLRRTTFTLTSTLTWGEMNLLIQNLRTSTTPPVDEPNTPPGGTAGQPPPQPGEPGAPPTQPPGTPTGGDISQPKPIDYTVQYASSYTNANVAHQVTRDVTLGGFFNYTVAGGTTQASRVFYPWTRGYVMGVRAAHTFRKSSRDFFLSHVLLQRGWSSNGNVAWSLEPTETWMHFFNPNTVSSLQAGLTISRFSQDNGLVGYSVYPNFAAIISHHELLARGDLSLMAGVNATPVLDPLRAIVDPRVGANAAVGWSRERFFSNLTGSVTISTAPPEIDAGAFDTYQADFVTGYRAADWLGLETGARLYAQQYQDQTSVPFGWAVYAAVDIGYVFVIRREKPAVPAAPAAAQ